MPPMPKIVYGTAWKKERTPELVYSALKTGFRGIDTACQPKHYREDLVGKGYRRAVEEGIVTREDVYIQTKFTSLDGQDRSQAIPYDPRAAVGTQVQQSVAKSLANLGVEMIDAVVLHSPLRTRTATLEAYRALEAFVDGGKIGRLGVSNIYDVDELAWLIGEARVPVSVVQNRWHEGNGWDWAVYDLCQKHDIAYQSFWTLTGSPSLLKSSPLTPRSLSGLWNITPLCGSTKEKHMAEALQAENLFGKEEPEVALLWKAMRGGR